MRLDGANVVLDGELSEPVWDQAPRVSGLVRLAPVEGGAGYGSTDWRVFYTGDALYIGVRVHQPEKVLRVHANRRDQLGADDTINIYLNPYPDRDQGYIFRANAVGIQKDLFAYEGSSDSSWDAIWDSAGVPQDDGYSVEVRIPFRSLRFPDRDVHDWRIGLGIFTGARGQIDIWPQMSADRGNEFVQLAPLTGITGIERGKGIDIIPSMVARASGHTDANESFQWDDRNVVGIRHARIMDAGVDLRYAITPGLTASATLNPDFSQVEADADQLDYNLRYPLLYPEKRHFFTEGADQFQTPVPLFYSRAINAPIGGLKVTGNYGRVALGLLSSWDLDPPPSLITRDATHTGRDTVFTDMTGKDAFTTILRTSLHEGRARIGTYFAIKEAVSRSDGTVEGGNELASIDGRLRLGSATYLNVQAAASRATAMTGNNLLGGLMFAQVQRTDSRLVLDTQLSYLSEDMRAETSAISRVGVVTGQAIATYKIPTDQDWLLFVRPEVTGLGAFDLQDGTDLSIKPGLTLQFDGQSSLGLWWTAGQEFFNGTEHRLQYGTAKLATSPTSWLAASLDVVAGSRIRYDPADTYVGRAVDAAATLSVWPTRYLFLEGSYIKSYFWRPGQSQPVEDVNLARAHCTFHFSRQWSARFIGQLNTYDQTLPTSFLLAYEYRAGTVFFAGYQDYEYYGPVPTAPMTPALQVSSRMAFLKLSYVWSL